MAYESFVVVDHDYQTGRRVAKALPCSAVRVVARAAELAGHWPQHSCLMVRDLDRQINEVLAAVEAAGKPIPIIAYGTNAQPERMSDLAERGVGAYWDVSETDIIQDGAYTIGATPPVVRLAHSRSLGSDTPTRRAA